MMNKCFFQILSICITSAALCGQKQFFPPQEGCCRITATPEIFTKPQQGCCFEGGVFNKTSQGCCNVGGVFTRANDEGCCPDVGIHKPLTQGCCNGPQVNVIFERAELDCCPDTDTFEPLTQGCCFGAESNQVYIFENQLCCSGQVLDELTNGCCNDMPYDKSQFECCNGLILPVCPTVSPPTSQSSGSLSSSSRSSSSESESSEETAYMSRAAVYNDDNNANNVNSGNSDYEITIILSDWTLDNLWCLMMLFVLANVTLMVYCFYLKTNTNNSKQTVHTQQFP